MSRPFSEIKRQELQIRRDGLLEEWRAANRQWSGNLSDSERLRIDRDMLSIENEIRKTDTELRTDATPVSNNERSVIEVQLAIIAMNRGEAEALEGLADQESFHQLTQALHTFQIDELSACYDDRRDDWKPLLADTERTIGSIIVEVTERLNEATIGRPGGTVVETRSLSEGFLSENAVERRKTWDAMEQKGGVIVVDAISMYHPIIRQHFLNSQLISANNSVGVVVLSPLKADAVSVNELLRAQVYDVHLERAFNYFADHWNPLYEFGVSDVCNLSRWLFTAMPRVRRTGLGPEARAAIQSQVGVAPQGIGSLISGS